MSLKLIINKVTRFTSDGEEEVLELKPGVNILEGPPNSGKTVWLNIIDFLMGDTGTIEDVLSHEDELGNKLYEKYIAASMDITISDSTYHIERRWTEQGMKGKLFVNELVISSSEFSDFLLNELNIPILHFPKGNPYTDKAWPSLSWRMMLRHIFRQENFWSDLADKQPDIEQHAVLSQFLGIADKLFSQNLGNIVNKRKELLKLEAEKEQFSSILDNIGKSMSNPNENVAFVTHESIENAIGDLETKIETLLEKKQEIFNVEMAKVNDENKTIEAYIIEISKRRDALIDRMSRINQKQKGIIGRIAEFQGLQKSIKQEIDKLNRTKEAGVLFADLKVSHCPACDQNVTETKHNTNTCFLCHQTISEVKNDNRVDFEISQLTAESNEITELIASLEKDISELNSEENKVKYDINLVERELAPLRYQMTALVSPEVGHLDAERGRLEEQIEGHKRMLKNLDYKDVLVKKIDTLNSEISKLETQLETQEEEINFEEVSSLLEEEMANYLNTLVKGNPDRWPHKRPNFRIGEKSFTIKVNEGKWQKSIGATSKLYFLFAYHYGLLALSKVTECNYPGLLIIDFPPELPNTEKNIFNENYVVEPFIDLCIKSSVPMQVIITGNAFKDIEGVNKVAMSSVWKH